MVERTNLWGNRGFFPCVFPANMGLTVKIPATQATDIQRDQVWMDRFWHPGFW
jgi:predicted cobalt transporter CbtA